MKDCKVVKNSLLIKKVQARGDQEGHEEPQAKPDLAVAQVVAAEVHSR